MPPLEPLPDPDAYMTGWPEKPFVCFYFEAPPDRRFLPRGIPAGMQEIEIITEGGGRFDVDGEWREVGPGDVLWYYPGEWICASSLPVAPYRAIVFQFCEPMLGVPRAPRLFRWRDPAECLRLSREAHHRVHADLTPGDLGWFSACLYARFVWEMAQPPLVDPMLPLALQRALDWIDRHATEAVSVDSIAHAAGTSASNLHHLFQQHLDTTPWQHLLQRRLTIARQHLSERRLSVKAVAMASGFSDAVHFQRVFKKHLRMTPGTYRRQHAAPVSWDLPADGEQPKA